jgi:hypothetical protein
MKIKNEWRLCGLNIFIVQPMGHTIREENDKRKAVDIKKK